MLPCFCGAADSPKSTYDRALRIANWYGRRTGRSELADLESAALEGLTKAARDLELRSEPKRRHRLVNKRTFWTFACAASWERCGMSYGGWII